MVRIVRINSGGCIISVNSVVGSPSKSVRLSIELPLVILKIVDASIFSFVVPEHKGV